MMKNDQKRSKKVKKGKSDVPNDVPRKLPPFVILRDGRWYVKRSYPTAEKYSDGRRVYVQVKVRCEPETAERAAEISTQIDAERNAAISDTISPIAILDDLCRQFLRSKKESVSARTYRYYRLLLESHVIGTTLGSNPVNAATVLDLQHHYEWMRSKNASPSLIKKVNGVISMVFTQAMKWEIASRNPTVGVILPSGPRPDVKAMEKHEAQSFHAACRSDIKYFLLEFALETGMRPGEYLALRWADIDLQRRTVSVRRALDEGSGVKGPKTFSGRRVIAITPILAERFEDYRQYRQTQMERLSAEAEKPVLLLHMKRTGANYLKRLLKQNHIKERIEAFTANDLVFPNTRGTFRDPSNLTDREFAEVLELAGLKDGGFTLYSLRHTSISLSLSGGASINAVSHRAGHSKPSFTLNVYGHVLAHAQEQTTAILSDSIYDHLKNEDQEAVE